MLLQKKYAVPALLIIIMLTTFGLYFPGLFGNFIFDDYPNIVTNTNAHLNNLSWQSIYSTLNSGVASSLLRPLSMLSFGINYFYSGLDPFAFKITNLAIHLITSISLYFLACELLKIGLKPEHRENRQIQYVSLLVTACWALHPLNVSTVLYIVQRMTQLSALGMIITLIIYCKFRQKEAPSTFLAVGTFGIISLLLIISILCKENAVLLVLYILSIELFLLRFAAHSSGQKLFLNMYYVVFLIIPAILAVVLLITAPEQIIGHYNLRSHTMYERLLTESRAIWVYIHWLIMPDTREFTFYHDDFAISHSLFEPISTLIAILGLASLMLSAWIFRKKMPFLGFGIAFFLAGHALESTFVALELVFEHRNYLPGFGLIFGVVFTLLNLPAFIMRKQIAIGFLVLYLAFLSQGTYQEAKKWSNANDQLASSVRQAPNSHRINYSLGFLYLSLATLTPDRIETLDAASNYFYKAAFLDDRATRAHFGLMIANSQIGKPIPPEIVDDLTFRLENFSLAQNGLTEISMLTECWYGGFCKFDKSELIRFYNAISDNKNSDPIVIQAILYQIGIAIIEVFKSTEDGKSILYLARNVRPDFTFIDIQLIQLELTQMNYLSAQQLIEESNLRPGNSSFSTELKSLSEELLLLENSQ